MTALLPVLRSAGPWIVIALLAVAGWGLWERGNRLAGERDAARTQLDRAVTINEQNAAEHRFEVERLLSDIDAVDAACARRVEIARQEAGALECLRRTPVDESESDVSPVLRNAIDSLRRGNSDANGN